MERDDLHMIAEGLERILTDAPLEAIDNSGGLGAEAEALWALLSENGYPLLCASEDHGGFGGSIADAAELSMIAGRHALSLPLGDTMLANALLCGAGIEPAEGALALADPLDGGAPIAHALQAQALLGLADGQVCVTRLDPAQLNPCKDAEDGAATGSGGELISQAPAPAWLTPEAFRALAALTRAASMAGAMQAVLDLTLEYTGGREQFGRPLAKFQAIQHHLADIACETAASLAAVEQAGDALRADPRCSQATLEEIAIAKLRCGEAASRVAAAAHQAHGAMGFTHEYRLGRYTRRLWQWQDEFGGDAFWAISLGNAVLSEDAPALWPRISRSV